MWYTSSLSWTVTWPVASALALQPIVHHALLMLKGWRHRVNNRLVKYHCTAYRPTDIPCTRKHHKQVFKGNKTAYTVPADLLLRSVKKHKTFSDPDWEPKSRTYYVTAYCCFMEKILQNVQNQCEHNVMTECLCFSYSVQLNNFTVHTET